MLPRLRSQSMLPVMAHVLTALNARALSIYNAVRRTASLRIPIVFIIACFLAYGLEHYSEQLVTDGNEHPNVSQSIFNARKIYQYVVASWPRRLVPRYTVLIEIDPEVDRAAVSLHNVCDQREMLARLIRAVADYNPAIIVIDKYFLESGCGHDHPNTLALKNAISAVSRRLPIVVGLRIDDRIRPTERGDGLFYHVQKPVAFDDAPLLREGIVNINADSRRLALGWTVVREGRLDSEWDWQNAIALEAAQAYDSMLLKKDLRLKRLIAEKNSPYLSMIPAEEFAVYFAGDLLCTLRDTSPVTREQCKGREGPTVGLDYLRGRIAIIGEVNADMDRHSSLIGNVPGVLLQANYIEALLDERYFAPVPLWVDYFVGFLFFVAIEAALRQRSVVRCLGSVVAVIVLTFVLVSLLVRLLGYYVNPITVSVLVLTLKLIFWLTERIARKEDGA
jgi:CHASE2 domain-containing sensor protein